MMKRRGIEMRKEIKIRSERKTKKKGERRKHVTVVVFCGIIF